MSTQEVVANCPTGGANFPMAAASVERRARDFMVLATQSGGTGIARSRKRSGAQERDMRTTIVTGLLGSGKTTFIRNSLDGRRERTAVLVNDFGQAGIDGEIISAGGVETVELPSGCVCCTLKPDLISSIRRIVDRFDPEHLVIEPSGIASPVGVLEALTSAGISEVSVVGIVDAVEFADLYEAGMYGNFFREQIELSDMVLVNKADIATGDQTSAAERTIEAINPRALLIRTVNAVIDLPLPLPPFPPLPVHPFHPLPLRERAGVRGSSF